MSPGARMAALRSMGIERSVAAAMGAPASPPAAEPSPKPYSISFPQESLAFERAEKSPPQSRSWLSGKID